MKIADFPCLNQRYEYDCGANAVKAVLEYYGQDFDERPIMKIAGTTSRFGTTVEGIKRTLKKFGLKYAAKKMTVAEVKRYIKRGVPVILLLQAWPIPERKISDWKNWWADGHYVIAMGYDEKKMYFEDPMCEVRSYLSFAELQDRWHDRVGGDKKKYYNLGIAVFGRREAFDLKRAVPMG
jgi:uncharacterized protein